MSIAEDLKKFQSAHGQELPAKLPGDDEKPCFVCQANQAKMKTAVFNAAYQVLKKKQEDEKMPGEIVLITDQKCPPCEDASAVLSDLIKSGNIKVVEYSSCPECDKRAISDKGITSVPVLASRGEDGKIDRFFPLASAATSIPLSPIPEEQLEQAERVDDIMEDIILDEELPADEPIVTESEAVQGE